MKNCLRVLICILILVACKSNETSDLDAYFIETIYKFPFDDAKFSDSLTSKQVQFTKLHHINVSIPRGFKFLIDETDPEAIILVNKSDTSMLVAKWFQLDQGKVDQIEKSVKYNSPVYGDDYNDLSEFQHFKKCERVLTDSLIGPFYFGGSLYELLGGDNVMHQYFLPKSNLYEFGELTFLFKDNGYLITCMLHNGFMEDLNEPGRWQAFSFNEY